MVTGEEAGETIDTVTGNPLIGLNDPATLDTPTGTVTVNYVEVRDGELAFRGTLKGKDDEVTDVNITNDRQKNILLAQIKDKDKKPLYSSLNEFYERINKRLGAKESAAKPSKYGVDITGTKNDMPKL